MIWKHRLGTFVATLALLATGVSVGGAAGATDPSFQCVVVNADTCTVTIPLTSNMNEQVGSTMPDTKPWFNSEDGGNGPYGLTGPGNPQTTWNGVAGALQGTVWTAILTTNANEPAGSQAVLTFNHVNGSTTTTTTTTTIGVPYSSISDSYPLKVAKGTVATVSATVRPVPAKGHLVLLHRSGANWLRIGSFTYSNATKKWSIKFTWRYPAHAVETFRLEATAAPGLVNTVGGAFKIATLG